jgi:chromosome segregation ATPase
MTENGLFAEQKLSITSELEQHHNDLVARTQELKTMQSQYHQMKRDYQQCKLNLQQVESDRDEAAAQALKYSEALSKQDAQLLTLQEQLTISKQHEHEVTRQCNELKRDLQTALKGHEEENYHTLKGVKVLEDRIRELQAALLEKTKESDNAQDTVRKLRREYQSTRQDAEAMLQVMTGLEKQVSEYAARENEIENLGRDSKLKITEAHGLRDQAILREKMLTEEVTRLQLENKKLAIEKFVSPLLVLVTHDCMMIMSVCSMLSNEKWSKRTRRLQNN